MLAIKGKERAPPSPTIIVVEESHADQGCLPTLIAVIRSEQELSVYKGKIE
jgi:hypothetical protein